MIEPPAASAPPLILDHPQAHIAITLQTDGHRRISVEPKKGDFFIPVRECLTRYPEDLIRLILEVKGADYLCDELNRDEHADYVERDLVGDITAYFDPEDFRDKRILDFGCGSGASTVILARNFPAAEIVGVELCADLLSIARARAAHYNLKNVRLLQSPSGTELPTNLGEFDFVVMSAVFEHLLPEERLTLTPKVWAAVKRGGHLFLNQTPNLWCPTEGHTTGLPLINYLPAEAAMRLARRYAAHRVGTNPTNEELLRKGIRGATEREVMRVLGSEAQLLEPSRRGMRDRVDLWFSALSAGRLMTLKKLARLTQKLTWRLFGFTLMPNLTMVVRKR